MFTGLVQRVGTLERLERAQGGWRVRVRHAPWPDVLIAGESVAVQGACLTVTESGVGFFAADLLEETLRCTALRQRSAGARVNLERALAWGERMGGHLVSGHVDETGMLLSVEPCGRDQVWRVGCSRALARQTVRKGSVAIDGVSLTVAEVGEESFEVHLIPTTLRETSLSDRRPGEALNLEGDIVGKYVARLLVPQASCGIQTSLLEENGFV